MRQKDISIKKIISQKEINLHIGMKSVQSGTAAYIKELKKFLEKDELHTLHKALDNNDMILAQKEITKLKKQCLNLGLMNMYELYIEMESVLAIADDMDIDELICEAKESKQNIMEAIA